ncbi:MAG: hypothetical protein JWQ02_3556 [Capsulimonas sp.]|nr:hypothetical protein [Capsulimonas sp.]
MNHFVERLPWRLAALAGLLVGAVSLANSTDVWICLIRSAAAFVIFGFLGVILRNILTQQPQHTGTEERHDHRGVHLDAVTPEMTLDDLGRRESGTEAPLGDDSER